jgi:hypothetical protein
MWEKKPLKSIDQLGTDFGKATQLNHFCMAGQLVVLGMAWELKV